MQGVLPFTPRVPSLSASALDMFLLGMRKPVLVPVRFSNVVLQQALDPTAFMPASKYCNELITETLANGSAHPRFLFGAHGEDKRWQLRFARSDAFRGHRLLFARVQHEGSVDGRFVEIRQNGFATGIRIEERSFGSAISLNHSVCFPSRAGTRFQAYHLVQIGVNLTFFSSLLNLPPFGGPRFSPERDAARLYGEFAKREPGGVPHYFLDPVAANSRFERKGEDLGVSICSPLTFRDPFRNQAHRIPVFGIDYLRSVLRVWQQIPLDGESDFLRYLVTMRNGVHTYLSAYPDESLV